MKDLTKRSQFFGRNFKLPKALAGGIKGGSDFIARVSEAVSYNQRQVKEGGKHIDVMIQNMYTMMAEQGLSKNSYKEFQNLERNLMKAAPGDQKLIALKNLTDYLGVPI